MIRLLIDITLDKEVKFDKYIYLTNDEFLFIIFKPGFYKFLFDKTIKLIFLLILDIVERDVRDFIDKLNYIKNFLFNIFTRIYKKLYLIFFYIENNQSYISNKIFQNEKY